MPTRDGAHIMKDNRQGGKAPPRKPITASNSAPNNNKSKQPSSNGNNNKQNRKANRRTKQLESMAKKAREEVAYFKRCQQEGSSKIQLPSSSDLFESHSSQGINFSKYDQIKVDVKHPTSDKKILPLQDFGDLQDISPQLLSNIKRMHYLHPTPIQKYAIPAALQNDLMCAAQTGSGKTTAFLLPVLAGLCRTAPSSQAQQTPAAATPACVIVAPTRELAAQIHSEALKLSFGLHDSIACVSIYGGTNARPQLRELALASRSCVRQHLVIVATPGRLWDFVERDIVNLLSVQYLVLDEADRMLDMGFEPQIRRLVKNMTPKSRRQTMLFSATFPAAIQKLAAEFMNAYVWIAVGRVGSTTESITQRLIQATPDKRHKLTLVVKSLQEGPDGRTLIFVQKKRTATWLKKMLNNGGPANGHPNERFAPYVGVVDIHGDRSQSQREAALDAFRCGTSKILVATDVAARGLDINGVEHVINMDLPSSRDEFDSYVHRIGRTGRKGNLGTATSLFVPGDDPKTGNGRIAGVLVQQLKEAKQEVPDWLEAIAGGGGSKRKPPKDVRGSNNGNQQKRGRNSNEAGGRGRNGGRGGRR